MNWPRRRFDMFVKHLLRYRHVLFPMQQHHAMHSAIFAGRIGLGALLFCAAVATYPSLAAADDPSVSKVGLLIGGGSDTATLWAVDELVERSGVRYLLHGDVLPEGQERGTGTFSREPRWATAQQHETPFLNSPGR